MLKKKSFDRLYELKINVSIRGYTIIYIGHIPIHNLYSFKIRVSYVVRHT
jgi:hypothetical protein